MALSDSWLRSTHGKETGKIVVKSDRDGLSARVSVKGSIAFQFRYRWNGKQERVDVGTYPATSLKEARDETVRLRGELESNRNPRMLKKMARDEAYKIATVEDVISEWYHKYCVEHKKNHAELYRSFEIYIFPRIGRYTHDETTLHHWLDVLEPLAKSVPAVADRILINAKQAHKWAYRRKLSTAQPIRDIGLPDLGIKKKDRDRVLSDDEIVTIFRAMEASRIHIKYQLLVKLCLLFACRSGELAFAERSHFNLDTMVWIIPPEFHKTGASSGKAITRPIIPEAAEMLDELFKLNVKSKFLIRKENTDEPIGRSTLSDIPEYIRRAAKRHLGEDLAHWTLHDLRRTARTNFSKFTEPHIAEIMLGHKLPGVWQIYDRSDYLDEQRRAYTLWWAKVESLIYGDGKISVLSRSS
ncbi:tyrosine-type recombinase/integrase [Erwinia mallotivora]|uniref:tyrosine-type recombinase/integrase n=1 Tax=Erwinia mallotivora TaxID=69222 RepID=UPI0021C1AC19|nr:site-specific integrase [Erwinia mallotivora]